MSGDKEKESPIKEIRKEPAPAPEKKPAVKLEEISDDDDSDGWDVPAFLRRGKK